MFRRPGTHAFYRWYFFYFLPLGFMVPRLGSFVYHELSVVPAGFLFLAAQIALPLGAFLTGLLSDFTGKFRTLLLLQTIGVSACLLILTSPPLSFFSIVLTFFVLHLALGGVNPLVSTGYLQSGLPEEKFAHARMYGTIGFLCVNLLLVLWPLSRTTALQLAAILFAWSAIFVWFLPGARKEIHRRHPDTKALISLLRSRHFLVFMGLMIWYNFQFISAETVLSEYLYDKKIAWGKQNLDALSVAWAAATLTETLFFLVAPALLRFFSPLAFLALSFAAGLARYLLLSVTEEVVLVALAQALHGLHFAPAYLASVLYTRQKSPAVLLATATALTQLASRALGGGFGGFVFGELGIASIKMVFLINAVAAAVGWLLLLQFSRTYGREKTFTENSEIVGA